MSRHNRSMVGSIRRVARDYRTLRTIPAWLSIGFVALSLFAFGGVSQFTLTWVDWTVTAEGAMFGSFLVYMVAFMSSATNEFASYASWEKVFVAGGPGMILLHGWLPPVQNFIASSQALQIAAFLFVSIAWGVATR